MRLRLDNVSVSYRTQEDQVVPALIGVNLQVEPGEHLAVVGANGSGKSTLAFCLAGLFQPTAGRVFVEGTNVREVVSDTAPENRAEDRPRGAVVFQSPEDNLIGASVFEEMSLTLEHRVGCTEGGLVREALAEFGIAHLADQFLDSLSGGEKQQVAVACAMASGRELVVLDEPTSHLDPPGRRKFFGYLDSLAGKGSAGGGSGVPIVVLVTQYEDEARRFDRVVELDGGRVVYDGPGDAWSGTGAADGDLAGGHTAVPLGSGPVIVRTSGLTQIDTPGWPRPAAGLKDISLEVRKGEAVGLCGPIGSGKTTLGYHLAGLFSAWDGVIEWVRGDRDGETPVVMIQFPERQFFCQTVLEDVSYGPSARGLAANDACTLGREALAAVGLEPSVFSARSPFGLSGGQKRRAAMAGIAAVSSPLYILDEPTAALDDEGLVRLAALSCNVRERGSAVVMISHDLRRLRSLTERVWVMDMGRIIFCGTWEQLNGKPEVLAGIGF